MLIFGKGIRGLIFVNIKSWITKRENYTIPEIITTLLYTNTIHTSQVKNIMYSKIEKGARLFSRHILLCNINLCVIHRYICFGLSLILSAILTARMHSDLYRIIIVALHLLLHWSVIDLSSSRNAGDAKKRKGWKCIYILYRINVLWKINLAKNV